MKTTTFGYHDVSYKIAVNRMEKRLEAEDVIIHKDGSVSMYCSDGIICERYIPTGKELR